MNAAVYLGVHLVLWLLDGVLVDPLSQETEVHGISSVLARASTELQKDIFKMEIIEMKMQKKTKKTINLYTNLKVSLTVTM